MDYASCYVIYVDKTARADRLVKKDATPSAGVSRHSNASSYFDTVGETEEVQANLQAILAVFNEVLICTTGSACSIKLAELSESTSLDLIPILVLVTVSGDERLDARRDRISQDFRTPSPSTARSDPIETYMTEDIYGIRLLHNIAVDIQNDTSTKLIVPIAVLNLSVGGNRESVSSVQRDSTTGAWFASSVSTASGSHKLPTARRLVAEPSQMLRCLDAGAADVLTTPLQKDRVFGLTTHAYRVRKEATKERSTFLATRRMRKRSWVGVDEEQPYAYLRESMVSGLMNGICKPESVMDSFGDREIYIVERRRAIVAEAVGSWEFSAHDFSDDELQYASFLMLEHALEMPQLEKWRLSTDDLKSFLTASRAAYNAFVVYHNFRHVVDVLQAVFTFLVRLGTLPPYPANQKPTQHAATTLSAIATLLTPFDALTLLISAIGHDVGHPGVNNAFLVSLNAPLAQLYNDKSVLEAFHCAAYSQILRRYWKAAFEDSGMRKLLINSILATDMGVHFKYMSDLGNLQQKLHDNDNTTDGWSPQILDEYRTLACGLLIKCADISNVARKYDVAAQWADILTLEFAKQGEMEKDVGIPTTLFGGPPELGSLVKLANSQIGFMNIFARPLFEAVTDIFPAMQFTVDEILANKAVWEAKIEQEKQKARKGYRSSLRAPAEGFHSPRSRSPVVQSEEREPSQESAPTITQSPTPFTGVPASQGPTSIPQGAQGTSQDLAIRPALGTPPQSPEQSRRSSLGSPFNYAATGQSPDMISRRSSGAFPSANIIPTSQTRRSSNTVPSQLQLGIDPSFTVPSAENIPPAEQPGEHQPTRTLDVAAAAGLSNGNGRARAGGGGRGSGARSSSVDTSPTKRESHRRQSTRHSNYPSSGRFSVPSSHDRYSLATSGANTSLSMTTPCSPSTQATSFLTVDSDEKSYNSDHENGRPLSSGIPTLVDMERGGRHGEDVKNSGVMTTVLSGDWSRTVTKRPSRFRLDFWKKRGKAQEASP